MNRRKYLSTIMSLSLISTVIDKQYTSDSDNDSTWCATTVKNSSLLSAPSDNPDFIVSGKKDVEVFWEPQEFFDNKGFLYAHAVANPSGSVIVLNKGNSQNIDDYVLLHELAHTLGYHHGDGGIVNTDTTIFTDEGDRSGDTLQQSTKDVGNSFDAYELYSEWDIQTLGGLGSEFAQDDLTVTDLGTAGQRFALNSNIEDLYIKHSHNGFGGVYESGLQPNSDNIYAGQFYKSE